MSWGPLRPAGTAAAAGVGDAAAGVGDAAAAAAVAGAANATDWPASAHTLEQARQVFLAGNQLPARWAGRDRFTVLDTGFGGGHKFLATWAAWQQDARRCQRLFYLAIEPRPPGRDQLARLHAATPLAALASTLAAQWPPLTPDLHVIDLAGGRLRLLLALGDIAAVLPEWVASVDAFYLDGPAAEPGQPAWDARRLRRLPRLAAPGATLAACGSAAALPDRSTAAALRDESAAAALPDGSTAAVLPTARATAALRDALVAAGFVLQTVPGTTDRARLTAARFAPRFVPPAPPGRQALAGVKTVAVVGAGLAGAAVARALAAQGLVVQVFDRRDGPARETSGNPGGLFHGIVHGHDGPHARWLRSAALRTEQVLRPLVDGGLVDGAMAGLLRGEQAQGLPAMQALLDRLGLPPDYVQAWPAALRGGSAAWFYPGGGWVDPAALCTHWLAAPGISTRFDSRVQALLPHGKGWQLQGADGLLLATVDAVVLCSAADIGRLLASPALADGTALADGASLADSTALPDGAALPGSAALPDSALHHHLHRVRGQITVLAATTPGLPALPLPLADTGYALTLADGRLLCGASAQPEGRDTAADHDAGLRPADHAHNLATLARLTGWAGGVGSTPLAGRVAWRQQSEDRLPLLGPVPALWAQGLIGHGPPPPAVAAQRPVQPRLVPRRAGLYVFTALGSRGISHAALGGEVLAAWISGDPVPAPASLLDALDPARFIARTARRPG